METITCDRCGAPIFYDDGLGYGICEYCGSIIRGQTRENSQTVNLDKEVQYIMDTKPYAWEYKLLFAVLDSGIQKNNSLKSEVLKPLSISGTSAKEEALQSVTWITRKLEKLPEYTEPLHQIFSASLPEAMGPPGCPGDDKKLVETANAIAAVYTGLLYWGLEFQTHAVPENLYRLTLAAKDIAKSILEDIERFCYEGRNNFAGLQPGMEVPKSTNLVLRELDMSVFMTELSRLGVV